MQRIAYMSVITFAFAVGAPQASAQGPVVENEKLFGSDSAPNDRFGRAVALSGTVAVVGAHQDDDSGDSSGSAYVYRLNGAVWTQEAKLVAADGGNYDLFGATVAVDNNVIVISSRAHDSNLLGSAYVFRFNGTGWTQEAKLFASDGAVGDFFGQSLSVSGDVVLVGALGDDDNGSFSGSAYVFRYNGSTWVQEQKLLPSDGAAGNTFGRSVSMSGNSAIVGAAGNGLVGSAYIYRFDGAVWSEEAKLGPQGNVFGYSVAIEGDVVVIGALHDTENGVRAGAAFVYRFDGANWNQEAKLLASDGVFNDEFGLSVSLSGGVIASGTLDRGRAYVFRFDGSSWNQTATLVASDGAPVGRSLAVSGEVVMLGAEYNYQTVYVFDLLNPVYGDADNDGLLDAEETQLGTDPLDPDSDDDGLLDGTEVDLQASSGVPGCPDPLNSDSDGDLILDGDEVANGTDPCAGDSDADGLCDLIDTAPTVPATTSGAFEDSIRALADQIDAFDLSLFCGPNNNANSGRRNSMTNRIRQAANKVGQGDNAAAVALISGVLENVDGVGNDDWMHAGAETSVLANCLASLLLVL